MGIVGAGGCRFAGTLYPVQHPRFGIVAVGGGCTGGVGHGGQQVAAGGIGGGGLDLRACALGHLGVIAVGIIGERAEPAPENYLEIPLIS